MAAQKKLPNLILALSIVASSIVAPGGAAMANPAFPEALAPSSLSPDTSVDAYYAELSRSYEEFRQKYYASIIKKHADLRKSLQSIRPNNAMTFLRSVQSGDSQELERDPETRHLAVLIDSVQQNPEARLALLHFVREEIANGGSLAPAAKTTMLAASLIALGSAVSSAAMKGNPAAKANLAKVSFVAASTLALSLAALSASTASRSEEEKALLEILDKNRSVLFDSLAQKAFYDEQRPSATNR